MIKKSEPVGRYNASMAGEFFVLAQLFLRGYVGSLTYGNAKKVDILAFGKSGKPFRLEVKTTRITEPKRTKLFGLNYEWPRMKPVIARDDNELPFYCFVRLRESDETPLYFIFTGREVADYLEREHKRWINSNPKRRGGLGDDRTFRVRRNSKAHGLKAGMDNGWSKLPA